MSYNIYLSSREVKAILEAVNLDKHPGLLKKLLRLNSSMRPIDDYESRPDSRTIRKSNLAYRRANNLCLSCGKPVVSGTQKCFQHWVKDRLISRIRQVEKQYDISFRIPRPSNLVILKLMNKWNAQQGKCAYTGKPLHPGLNASLDHIRPVSKFPELIVDPDNLQWVLRDINSLKSDMSHEEFLESEKLALYKKTI